MSTTALSPQCAAERLASRGDIFCPDPASEEICAPTSRPAVYMRRLARLVPAKDTAFARLLNAMRRVASSVFLLIHSDGNSVEFYIGAGADDASGGELAMETLSTGIAGAFPGTVLEQAAAAPGQFIQEAKAVAAVLRAPFYPKKEEGDDDAEGFERFLDAMAGRRYTAMLLAEPLNDADLAARRAALENLHDAISPKVEITRQHSDGGGKAQQSSQAETKATSTATAISDATTDTTSDSDGRNFASNKSFSPLLMLGFGHQKGRFSSKTTSTGNTQGSSITNATADQTTTGVSNTDTTSYSDAVTIRETHRAAHELCDELERAMEGMARCERLGAWVTSGFFFSDTVQTSCIAAVHFDSIVLGTDAERPRGGNLWVWNVTEDPRPLERLRASLAAGCLPLCRSADAKLYPLGIVTDTASLSASFFSLPQRSVPGLPVLRPAADFGREPVLYAPDDSPRLCVGRAFANGIPTMSEVCLSLSEFPSHLLIAGASGTGKTAFIASLLHALPMPFLVVEPVKGEYKNLLWGLKNLDVYTADPGDRFRTLHIDPFAFSPEVHVYNHIDRLLDVLQTCWPLYAAQPAILRACIEEAYRVAGWDLANSTFIRGGEPVFPTFRDLQDALPGIMEKSHFIGEPRATYLGALTTRLQMLRQGLFGEIFRPCGALRDEELFAGRVVIDLSALDNAEAKAVVMGVLLMRLREFRAAHGAPDNRPIEHLFVLEEAHTLLARQQALARNDGNGDTASAKAVTMLSSSIAEMRGYGQSVLLCDQSPGQLDSGALRNTSTKIVFRISETEDQKAVSSAMALSDEQAGELPRLPNHVAAIKQANWMEPVLAQIATPSFQRRPAATGERMDAARLRDLRGALAGILLASHDDFPYAALDRALSQFKDLGGIVFDLKALLEDHGRRIASVAGRGGDVEPLYGRCLIDLLRCEDALCGLPSARRGDNDGSIVVFKAKCGVWMRKAAALLDHCAHVAQKTWTREALQLMLAATGGENADLVSAALFGRKEDEP